MTSLHTVNNTKSDEQEKFSNFNDEKNTKVDTLSQIREILQNTKKKNLPQKYELSENSSSEQTPQKQIYNPCSSPRLNGHWYNYFQYQVMPAWFYVAQRMADVISP